MIDLIIFRSALRDQLRPRRMVVTLILASLPPLLALIWRTTAREGRYTPEVAYNTLATVVVFGFALVILAVIYATAVVTQDVEGKTIVYLLTRPVARWRILAAKFLASFLVLTLSGALSLTALAMVTYGPVELGHSRLVRDLAVLPVGVLAYGSLFMLLATFTRRAMILALLYAFGWESWVPNLPGSFQKLSLMAYLRVLAPHPNQESGALGEGLGQILAPTTITRPTAWIVLTCVIFASLVGAMVLFSEREYVPREDAD